jgi:mannonate dehydratase
LEPYHLFWLEDPVAAELQESFRLIRQHTTTPLAVGEVFNTLWDAEQLIREQLIDYLRMSVVHGGGLTAMKKAADFAALYHVQTGCHGASDMSPVCMAAALHLGIAINNFGIQEHMLHNAQTEDTFTHAYAFRDGSMYPGDLPGLGVDIREDIAERFQYQRAYLPVNRKEDGTLFHW